MIQRKKCNKTISCNFFGLGLFASYFDLTNKSIYESFTDSPREILSNTPDVIDVVEAGGGNLADLSRH